MGIKCSTMAYNREYENQNWVQLSVEDELVVEEVLEIGLWLEDFVTVRLF
jgi:hypothetical protein